MAQEQDCTESLAQALHEAQAAKRELDRKVFLLKTLHQAAREFITLKDPGHMLANFLLTCMGAMGAAKGFALILDPDEPDPLIAHQGLDELEAELLRRESDTIAKTYISGTEPEAVDAGLSSARLVVRNRAGASSALPSGTDIALVWSLSHGRSGLCGLGSRITDESYGAEEEDYLLNLVDLLAQAMSNAIGARTVRRLNHELEHKNQGLERALALATRSQVELDTRIYHLGVLYDATVELSRVKDAPEIMDTFLLLLVGSFSAQNGLILIPGPDDLNLSLRGDFDAPPDISPQDAEKLLYAGVGAVAFEKLSELSALEVPNPGSVFGPHNLDLPRLPLAPRAAILFRIDNGPPGLLCLGPRLTGDAYGEEDMEVLLTLTGHFLMFMKTARAFATIQGLNLDLSKRNVELQATLNELTASRSRIEILERAGARIRAALQHEGERLGRASKLDLLWVALAALALGLAFNLVNPKGVALAPAAWTRPRAATIEPAAALELVQGGQAVLVDARPTEFYNQGHLAEAVNLPPALFDFVYSMKFAQLDPDVPLVVYGRTFSSLYDEDVAYRLSSKGHGQVMVLAQDLQELDQQGFPLE